MRLTGENILRIQQYLIEKGFIQSVASETWDNSNKTSGYQTYLESLGVPYPQCTELPISVEMLPEELRNYVTVPDNIHINLSEDDEDLDLDSEDDDEDDEDSELDDTEFKSIEDANLDYDEESEESEKINIENLSSDLSGGVDTLIIDSVQKDFPDTPAHESIPQNNDSETPISESQIESETLTVKA